MPRPKKKTEKKPEAKRRKEVQEICHLPGFRFADSLSGEKKEMGYLWFPWIAKGTLTLITGLPELGKTTLLVRILSAVTQGQTIGTEQHGEASRAFVLSSEDNFEVSILPRIKVIGGNPSKLIVPQEKDERGHACRMTFPSDCERLIDAIRKSGATLVVIDPLAKYVVAPDLNQEIATREILDSLQHVAQETGASVITSRNFNKSQSGPLLSRINGSAAFRDVPRSILAVTTHPREKGQRVLVHAKCSYAEKSRPLNYSLTIMSGQPVFTVGEESDLKIEECEDRISSSGERAEWRAAHEHVRGMIDTGWIDATKVYSAAAALGISKSNVWRAADELEVVHRRIGFGAGSRVEWGPPLNGWPPTLAKPEEDNSTIPPIDSSPEGEGVDPTPPSP